MRERNRIACMHAVGLIVLYNRIPIMCVGYIQLGGGVGSLGIYLTRYRR